MKRAGFLLLLIIICVGSFNKEDLRELAPVPDVSHALLAPAFEQTMAYKWLSTYAACAAVIMCISGIAIQRSRKKPR